MLESTWFILWGLLWIGYFILDGFDLGVGILMPFISRNEQEKQIVMHSIGPFWDGNEVWLIAAGGVTFAAFPAAYAALFSGLYTALMLLLFGLIIRGVSVEFRSQLNNRTWRSTWDAGIFIGSFLPALLLGVAFANIFKGLPIDANAIYQGTFLGLLNIYGILGGILFILLFLTHGAIWLCIKTSGDLQARSASLASKLWVALVVAVILFLLASIVYTNIFSNYLLHPWLFVILLLAVGGILGIRMYIASQRWFAAWISSALSIASAAMLGLAGIYPAIIPSSLNPGYSLTISNSSSSTLTLSIMLGVALVFVPIVILYQLWSYKRFSHTVTAESIEQDEAFY